MTYNRLQVWLTTAFCIIAIDLLVFRTGLFWRVRPDFGTDLFDLDNWNLLYNAAHDAETQRAVPAVPSCRHPCERRRRAGSGGVLRSDSCNLVSRREGFAAHRADH